MCGDCGQYLVWEPRTGLAIYQPTYYGNYATNFTSIDSSWYQYTCCLNISGNITSNTLCIGELKHGTYLWSGFLTQFYSVITIITVIMLKKDGIISTNMIILTIVILLSSVVWEKWPGSSLKTIEKSRFFWTYLLWNIFHKLHVHPLILVPVHFLCQHVWKTNLKCTMHRITKWWCLCMVTSSVECCIAQNSNVHFPYHFHLTPVPNHE